MEFFNKIHCRYTGVRGFITLYEYALRYRYMITPEALNEKKRIPKNKRKRSWHPDIIAEIKRQRWEHPNLGKEKLYPILKAFCVERNLACPKSKTIGRLIQDCGWFLKTLDITARLCRSNERKRSENQRILRQGIRGIVSRWILLKSIFTARADISSRLKTFLPVSALRGQRHRTHPLPPKNFLHIAYKYF